MRKMILALALLSGTAYSAATLPPPARDAAGNPYQWSPVIIGDGAGNQLGTATSPLNVTASGDAQGTGTLALGTLNATYIIPLTAGRSSIGLTISGLTGSGATITAERSNDGGATWTNANTTESSATSSLSATLTANGQPRVGAAGATNLRLRVSTAGTGTATIAYNASAGVGPVFLTSLLPNTSTPGTNVIGGVNNQMVAGNTISVGAGTGDIGTQRVALATDGPNGVQTDARCNVTDVTACGIVGLLKQQNYLQGLFVFDGSSQLITTPRDKNGVQPDYTLSVPVTTSPATITAAVTPGTVTTANTFQTILTASATRQSCTVVNNSANIEYLYVQPTSGGTASVASSIPLSANGTFNCAQGGIVLGNALQITSGTAASTFLVING